MNRLTKIELNQESLVYFCDTCYKLYPYINFVTHIHIRNLPENNHIDNVIINDTNKTDNNKIDDNKIDDTDKIENIAKTNKSSKNKKAKNDQNIPKMENELLTTLQKEVVIKSRKKAKIYNDSLYGNVLVRFIELGFNEDDIKKTVEHIKNVKVISHFGRIGDNLNWLINDTHLRNIFEVHNTLNTSRVTWEDNLFFKLYNKDCPFSERVKYGCLNLFNQNEGCISAHGYGKSYMVLKDSVKERTTFVCDLDKQRMHLCTFEYCVQALLYLKNETLKKLVDFVNGKDAKIDKINYIPIEVQVHGDVIFKRDVEEIVFHPSSINDNIRRHLENVGIPFRIQHL